MIDHLALVVSREEVITQDCSQVLSALNSLLDSPEKAAMFKENVDIGFSGYDEDSRELFEIDEVRNFVFKLDDAFPFWLFFLTKFGTGLQCVFLCLMPPHLTKEGQARIFPERLGDLLEKRWLPGMNYTANYVGMSEQENEKLTERGISYLTEGVFKLARKQ